MDLPSGATLTAANKKLSETLAKLPASTPRAPGPPGTPQVTTKGTSPKKQFQVFKAHFISILCGCDKSFPLYLWDRLLPQAEHTLNMLRPAGMTPTVSAYTYLWGQHVYNANPFAPLGCKVEAHVTAGRMRTPRQLRHHWC